jgi:hypothetical protein
MTLRTIALGIVGLALAVAVGLAANAISRDSVGLAPTPAGSRVPLAPAKRTATPAPRPKPKAKRPARKTPTTSTPTTSTPTTTTPPTTTSGGDDHSGRGGGRGEDNSGRGGGDD